MKSLLLTSSLVLALLGACAKAYAQPPAQRASPSSLAITQNAIRRTVRQMIAARQARQGTPGGHVVPAKASVSELTTDLQ